MSNTSLPVDQSEPNSRAKPMFSRFVNPLTLMLVLFGFPYVASWYFLDNDTSLPFSSLGNHGELVSPMLPLGDYSLTTNLGAELTKQNMAGNWLLLTTSSSCKQACQDTLLMIRQARKSTGINRKVIKPLILLQTENALEPFDVDLSEAFPQLAVIPSDTNKTQPLLDILVKAHPDAENNIYMVDPYNNLMMVYPADTTPKGLMDDLKRLLKVNKPKL